ncbi:hypothetical protein [Mycolicibacterium komossense]|uniref:Uncharacterized protein n=1 Tax=Mycolicibacterium komossense TaxID=1779 RepID=A0ABT3CAV9_9MYCO|nr:hypothetical protein [Mycolicibacterium komossense]MCV7226533.1 hypothetical protein [Mycolicibacterium komossense]
MKNLGFATVVAGALAAGVVGLAAPAQAAVVDAPAAVTSILVPAGIDHHSWLDQITPDVHVPKVDTSVQHSGR